MLVTGGSGFIGSHVVDKLAEAGMTPSIFDIAPSPYHGAEVETALGDLLDLDALRGALRGCDAVVHCAASSDVNIVAESPFEAERLNSRGTATLLEAVRLEQTPRVAYASTIWVYGDLRSETPITEDVALPLPSHLYTATKLAGESYCRSYGELFGVEHTILRFGIPYGPRARPATVLAAFVKRALAGEPLTIQGDGSQSRRFVYVEDLAEGVVAALVQAGANRIFNLVGSENTTIREIAETVGSLVGEVEISYLPSRAADIRGSEISGERAATELRWRPTTRFGDGARRYVDWVTSTGGSPSSASRSAINGKAAAVARHESREP
ncbi:MAG: NAD-dependent epimerase/dehydratase family protein [Gaiellaceae bacterium]